VVYFSAIGIISTLSLGSSATEVLNSNNSLEHRQPFRVPLTDSTFEPGQNIEVPFTLHSERLGEQDLHLIFAFREVNTELLRYHLTPY
jgi:hypothetical protein